MEDFTEANCTEASTKAFTKGCMKDKEDMTASTEVTLTGTSAKAPAKASIEVTYTKASMESLKRLMEVFAKVTST